MKRKYKVLYTHQKHKKQKVWQDGFLSLNVAETHGVLLNENYQPLSTVYFNKKKLTDGLELENDKYLIQVEEEVQHTSLNIKPVTGDELTPLKENTTPIHKYFFSSQSSKGKSKFCIPRKVAPKASFPSTNPNVDHSEVFYQSPNMKFEKSAASLPNSIWSTVSDEKLVSGLNLKKPETLKKPDCLTPAANNNVVRNTSQLLDLLEDDDEASSNQFVTNAVMFQKHEPSKFISQSAIDNFDLELPSFFDDKESASEDQTSSARFSNLEDKYVHIKGEIEVRGSNIVIAPALKPVVEDELYHSSLQNEQDEVISCLENLLSIVVKNNKGCSLKQNSDLNSDVQQEYFKSERLQASLTSVGKLSDCQDRNCFYEEKRQNCYDMPDYKHKLDINIPKVSSCLCEDIYVCTDKTDPESVVTKDGFEKNSQIVIPVLKSKPSLFVANETETISDLSKFDILSSRLIQNCGVKGKDFSGSFCSFGFSKNLPLSSDSEVVSSTFQTNCTTKNLFYDDNSQDACVPDCDFEFSEVKNSPELSIIKILKKKEASTINKVSETLQEFLVKRDMSVSEAKIDNFQQSSAPKKDKTGQFVINCIVSHSNCDNANLKCIATNSNISGSEDDAKCKISLNTSPNLNSVVYEDKSISYSPKDCSEISSIDELSNASTLSSLPLKKEMPPPLNDSKAITCDQRVPSLFEDFSNANEDEVLLLQDCMLPEDNILRESGASVVNNALHQKTSSNKDLSKPTFHSQNISTNFKVLSSIPNKCASPVHHKNTFHSQKIGKCGTNPVASLSLLLNSDKKNDVRLKVTECVAKSCHLVGADMTASLPAPNTQRTNFLPVLNFSTKKDSQQTDPTIKQKQFYCNAKKDYGVANHVLESFLVHSTNSDPIEVKNKLSDAETISKLGGVCSKKVKSSVFRSKNKLLQKDPLKSNLNKFTTYSGLSQSDLITKEVFNPLPSCHFEPAARESAVASQYLGKSVVKAEEKVGVFQPNELLFSLDPCESLVTPRSCNLLKQNTSFSKTYPLHVEEILQPPVFQDSFYNFASYTSQRPFPSCELESIAVEKPQCSSKWTRFKNEDQYVPDRKKLRKRWLEKMVKQEKNTPRKMDVLRTPDTSCHITENISCI